MPRFREYPPLVTATAGILIIAAGLAIAFVYPKLPIARGPVYTAQFTESGGMKVDDDVWVAGVKVGKVVNMEINGPKVDVEFTAKGIRLGRDVHAAIKTATLLGKRYLGVIPGTGEELSSGDTIPLAQTVAPYSVSRSIEQLTQQVHDFDKPKIEQALNVFADTFQDTPENFRATFKNVTALSKTISSRDQALGELFAHANVVSAVLADRTGEFESIIDDGNRLLAELQQRRELFQHLFERVNYVAEQARDFVRENNGVLKGSLDQLNDVLRIIQSNNANLSLALQRISGFITGLGEGVANGPAFSASLGLHTVGDLANYTDVLRQGQNPQAPNIPGNPGLPGGLGHVPNPLYQGPAGNAGQGVDRPTPINPTNSGHETASSGSGLPLLGGN